MNLFAFENSEKNRMRVKSSIIQEKIFIISKYDVKTFKKQNPAVTYNQWAKFYSSLAKGQQSPNFFNFGLIFLKLWI